MFFYQIIEFSNSKETARSIVAQNELGSPYRISSNELKFLNKTRLIHKDFNFGLRQFLLLFTSILTSFTSHNDIFQNKIPHFPFLLRKVIPHTVIINNITSIFYHFHMLFSSTHINIKLTCGRIHRVRNNNNKIVIIKEV